MAWLRFGFELEKKARIQYGLSVLVAVPGVLLNLS
jgi:hypothetical protein